MRVDAFTSVKKMNPTALSVAVAIMFVSASSHAAQLNLSNAPANASFVPPAPNIIIAVDDSGSMGRKTSSSSRIIALRNALRSTFDATTGVVPDASVRLGWSLLNACKNATWTGQEKDCPGSLEKVRVLDGTVRDQFMTWLNALDGVGNTPTQRQLWNVGSYYQTAHPWDGVPGASDPNPGGIEPLACRRSYTVLLTDGEWNQTSWIPTAGRIGNYDNTVKTFPDGTSYDPGDAQSRVYRDSNGTSTVPYVADMAFYFWANDLRTTMPNKVQPLMDAGQETIGGVSVDPYWNPRNNPATWQHMTTYTIGFGSAATGWSAFPKFGSDTWTGVDYQKLWQGGAGNVWTNQLPPDLWHAALNSRGEFVPVVNPGDLAPAFSRILSKIQADSSKPPVTSFAAGGTTPRNDFGAFSAGYEPDGWTGYVKRREVVNGVITNTPSWDSQLLMDAKPATWYTSRKVITSSGFDGSIANGGVNFAWPSLTTDQKALLQKNVSGVADTDPSMGEKRLNFIKGDRTNEGTLFRKRESLHGDVVGSAVWHHYGYAYHDKTKDKTRGDTVYVGANDGMLHGFDANTGEERLAYVPKGVLPRLSRLTAAGYTHDYFVDGSQFTVDAERSSGTWSTVLAGALGGGGKGYYLLDVTSPQSFSATDVLLDATFAANDVTGNPWLGHVYSKPVMDLTNTERATQIVKLNNGKWAYVTGNGYNSVNEGPALIIHFLDGAGISSTPKIIIAGSALPANFHVGNGLSAPRLVDLNNDGIPDVAYAGDLKGHLWKFDLSDSSDTSWGVALGGNPLFSDPDERSITGAPAYALVSGVEFKPANPEDVPGGLMLTFGTGRNLTDADRSDSTVQRMYGVMDSETWKTRAAPKTHLIELANDGLSGIPLARLVGMPLTVETLPSGVEVIDVEAEPIDYKTKLGWYVDLLDNLAKLQTFRVVSDIYSMGEGHQFGFSVVLEKPATSSFAAGEACEATALNAEYARFDFHIASPDPHGLIGGYAGESGDQQYISETPYGGVELGVPGVQKGLGPNVCITDPTLPQCRPPSTPIYRLVQPTWRALQ